MNQFNIFRRLFSLVLGKSSKASIATIITIVSVRTLTAIAIPLTSVSHNINFSSNSDQFRFFIALGALYLIFASVSKCLIRNICESVNGAIRISLFDEMTSSFKRGSTSSAAATWINTTLMDMQRLRDILEDSFPRLVSNFFTATISAVVITYYLISFAPIILLSACLISLTAILFGKIISTASKKARSSEERFNQLLTSYSRWHEAIYGNTYAPKNRGYLQTQNYYIISYFRRLNYIESILGPLFLLVVLMIGALVSESVLSKFEGSLSISHAAPVTLWLVIGIPAILDIINSSTNIFRLSPSINRVWQCCYDSTPSKIFKFSANHELVKELTKASSGLWKISGPSGSGKTSLTRFLCSRFQSVAYVPQDRPVIDLSIPLAGSLFFGLSSDLSWLKKFYSLCDKLNLDHESLLKLNSCETLSGGEKTRVVVALALCSSADIIILDEPEAGLDQENKQLLEDVINDECLDRRVVWSGHFVESES